ncbi:OmpA family protein [Motiliproteus sp. SC1-56]|uniref:OmpA family protein n=1 Tax=Motiliproteus sp. SC1-56 TaxID=2799565 RepID=UPI001A8F7D00|nr:OmpA family protein [Motiliproteus sp. SC1-56]
MRKLLLASSVAACMALPATVWAHGSCDENPEHCAYWHNSDGKYVKNSDGDCVRTSSWFEGTQIEGCDVILPKDADGDGVTDDIDQCANTPPGTRVDSRGCELDSDNDGVVDSSDQCANTPAGTPVDSRGCERDSDGDGVVDSKDSCPGTRSGVEVDAKGCPIPKFKSVSVNLRVTFGNNSAEVSSAQTLQMQALAHVLKSNPNIRVHINGHTDSVGDADYNMQLSEKRAQAVVDYMVENYDVDRGQLRAVGYGETQPVADNATAEGRALNRRVEADVKGKVEE